MNTSRGIHLALITAFISGVSIFVNKFAVGVITPPLVFTSTKNFLVGVLVLLVLVLSGKWKKLSRTRSHDRAKLLAISVVGGSLPFYLFFTGLAMIPAVNAAIIHKTLVLWVAVLAAPFLGERLSKLQGIAVLLMFLGNLMVGGFEGFTFSIGELMVLAATLLWSAETILAKKVLSGVDPDIVTWSRMGVGSLFLMGASLFIAPRGLMGVFSLTGGQLFWMSLTAVFLLGYVTSWYRALQHAPAVLVSSVLVLSTLITNVLSAVFITHNLMPVIIPQAALMILGLGLYWSTLKGMELRTSSVQ